MAHSIVILLNILLFCNEILVGQLPHSRPSNHLVQQSNSTHPLRDEQLKLLHSAPTELITLQYQVHSMSSYTTEPKPGQASEKLLTVTVLQTTNYENLLKVSNCPLWMREGWDELKMLLHPTQPSDQGLGLG